MPRVSTHTTYKPTPIAVWVCVCVCVSESYLIYLYMHRWAQRNLKKHVLLYFLATNSCGKQKRRVQIHQWTSSTCPTHIYIYIYSPTVDMCMHHINLFFDMPCFSHSFFSLVVAFILLYFCFIHISLTSHRCRCTLLKKKTQIRKGTWKNPTWICATFFCKFYFI